MVGKLIDGYNLIGYKGKGTFGSVYVCEKQNEIFAMKVFSSDFVFNEFINGSDNRISREINALKMVDSEYVVKYVDDGRFDDNNTTYYYVVMDYVEGDDLENILKSRNLTIDEVIQIFQSLIEGVNAIHNARLVHRDLKPGNIYLLKGSKVKILDFGLSKLIDFTSITSTGDIMGTPLYMSPEQISDSKNIDYRSDYYALGVILFKLLTNQSPYGQVSSREELYYKINLEPAMSVRAFIPIIDNSIDNLVTHLLQKKNFMRPNTIDEIKNYLMDTPSVDQIDSIRIKKFAPTFFLRLWNEKRVLSDYFSDGYSLENAIFPINHQNRQRGLLDLLKKYDVSYIIDPATMRLAYDTYSENKGLIELPYAPSNLSRLELDDFVTHEQKRQYVESVVNEQLKYNPRYIVAPFHVSNNSNLVKIKMDMNENWFSLDIKLLNETRNYLSQKEYNGKLVGGFCIKCDILTSNSERDYFLNTLTGLDCDMYWVYVDCIDNNSNCSQLLNYANSLLHLQKSSNKPVIAGRVGGFGLVLLAFGLYGFESGTSRFESFYEDLYKDASDSYNMYVRYYFPELMSNVAIDRKNPAKIIQLLESNIGHSIRCSCPYCINQPPAGLVNESLTRKHFLYRRNEEILKLRSYASIKERVEYIENRIKNAIEYFKNLKPIFKEDDSKFLKNWLEVVQKLKENWV